MFISALGIIFSFTQNLQYSPINLFISLMILVVGCFGSNIIFSKIFKAPTNIESSVITGLILFLILTPLNNLTSTLILLLAAFIAMASKYILVVNKKHIFNPAALSAVMLGIFLNYGAIWWIATPFFLPFTLIIGFLIVRKLRRFTMLFAFLIPALISLTYFGVNSGLSIIEAFRISLTAWPLIFFGTVMFTEPRTMPPTKQNQIMFGMIIGLLFAIPIKLGPLAFTPEFALIIGNIFAFLVSSRQNYFLKLAEKIKLAPSIYEFRFSPTKKLDYLPGQYLEWTLPHRKPDMRGNRRFFTIASSPTENDIRLGIKITDKSSSFKNALLKQNIGSVISAGLLAGDFTLPNKENEKLVLIAGGIGITPFRSMIKYIIDAKQKRDVILFYACSDPSEFVYKDIFEKASYSNLLKVIYVITHAENAPTTWHGEKGRITADMIKDHVADCDKRRFYLSGPNSMVQGYKELLNKMGIKNSQIKTDYFPGY